LTSTNIKRTALVTGASRRGAIGAAISRALAADGFDIAFTYWSAYDRDTGEGLDDDGPASLRTDIEALGRQAVAIEMDLSDPVAPRRLLDQVERAIGNLVVVVNNAAYSTREGIDGLDAEILDRHYAVNLRATALITAEFARRWSGRDGGRVINLTSGQSLGPMPDELAYVASKGAIEAFTLSASPTLARRGITINAVDPGPTDSGWMSEELKRQLAPRFPLGRIGQPEDVARLVAFLASEAGGWITGQVIHSEGGFIRDRG
jgi:3-oxoacyl-[acyl-carrier protein] reductase